MSDLNRDIDDAVETLFSTLDDIASKHSVDPKTVGQTADDRGMGADGYEQWCADNDEPWVAS